MGSMPMNMAANILGLANAATPLGIRAMKDLETLNLRPGIASNASVHFLAINTSLFNSSRRRRGCAGGQCFIESSAIVGTAILATICSTAAGIIAVKLLENCRAIVCRRLNPAGGQSSARRRNGKGRRRARRTRPTESLRRPHPLPMGRGGRRAGERD
jgi:spore maturation protein SpmA